MKRSLVMTTIPKSGQAVWGRQWLIFGVVVLMSMIGVNAAFAQSVSSGTIEGTVKDESSGVLPGVTVTVTSPQLQVDELIVSGCIGHLNEDRKSTRLNSSH